MVPPQPLWQKQTPGCIQRPPFLQLGKQTAVYRKQIKPIDYGALYMPVSYTIGSPYHFDILYQSIPQRRSKSQETHSDHCSGIHREESRWLHYKGAMVTISAAENNTDKSIF